MHDHSRFQRDINDVTGVSLSLSLSLSQKSQYRKHNIGSASALPIIRPWPPGWSFLRRMYTSRGSERVNFQS